MRLLCLKEKNKNIERTLNGPRMEPWGDPLYTYKRIKGKTYFEFGKEFVLPIDICC